MERWRINHLKSASSPAPTATSAPPSLSEPSSSASVRHALSLNNTVGGSSTPTRRGIYCDCATLGLFGWFCLGWKVKFNRCDPSTFSPVEKQRQKNVDVISSLSETYSRLSQNKRSSRWVPWKSLGHEGKESMLNGESQETLVYREKVCSRLVPWSSSPIENLKTF